MTPRPDVPAGPDWAALAGAAVTLLSELAAGSATGDRAEPRHDAAFCRVCPLCRLITRLREVRPDLADQLTGAAEGVEAALRALLAPAVPSELAVPPAPTVAAGPGEPDGEAAERDSSGHPDHPPAWPSTVRPPIERIEVTG